MPARCSSAWSGERRRIPEGLRYRLRARTVPSAHAAISCKIGDGAAYARFSIGCLSAFHATLASVRHAAWNLSCVHASVGSFPVIYQDTRFTTLFIKQHLPNYSLFRATTLSSLLAGLLHHTPDTIYMYKSCVGSAIRSRSIIIVVFDCWKCTTIAILHTIAMLCTLIQCQTA